MNPTKHVSRRLRRRAWLQRQAILVLENVEELTGKEILLKIRQANNSPTQRGWCEASPVSFGLMMRELAAKGLLIRIKLPSGSYSYSKPSTLDVKIFNDFFGLRGLHPSKRL
jgi:hypothetical protein